VDAHLRDFDRQLEAIEAKVTDLFAMVCEDLPGVTAALLTGHYEAAGQLAEREQAINALYYEIEEVVSLLRAPVTSDQRFLLSVLRIAPELERSHDLVCHIASGGRPCSRHRTAAALLRANRTDGRTCLRHVAAHRGLLVPAGQVRRIDAGRSQ